MSVSLVLVTSDLSKFFSLGCIKYLRPTWSKGRIFFGLAKAPCPYLKVNHPFNKIR